MPENEWVQLAKQRARDLAPALATLGLPFADVRAVQDTVIVKLTPGEAGDLLHQLDKLRPR
jgi:hypothetical protein